MPKLNNTAAIGGGSGVGEEHTISSRKIANGYVISSSTYNRDTGDYKSSEVFSKDPPKLQPATVQDLGGEGNPLSVAVEMLKRP